jgi:hypothetical protein
MSRNTHKIDCPLPRVSGTLLVLDVQRTTGLTTPAPEAVKEVAHMNTNTIRMAVQIPSGFGMPICGHPAQMNTAPTNAGFATTAVVRERATAVKGDMDLAYVLGTSAWRPPSS